MLRASILRCLVVAFGLLAGEVALAQSGLCQRYQAELASLGRGGGQASAAADRQRAEIGRLVNYYRSIGCERGGFFFGGPPAECGSIAQRIRQMEGNLAQLSAQAGGDEVEARRRQLVAAIQQTCAPQPQQVQQPRNIFEAIFGVPRVQPMPQQRVEDPDEPRLGGRRLVCVRTCDGFFFPLGAGPSGRESADEMCQALCPGAEAAAFTMPGGDDSLDQAVSVRGKPYVQLPGAFKYQRSFDPTCSCKKSGETWAEQLRRAESMLDQRRGDIIVTAQKAEEMSRPKITPVQMSEREKKAAERKAAEAAQAEAAAAESGAAAPTAGRESSGIGPQSIEASRIFPVNEGPRLQVVSSDGVKRTVRVVAPNVIPVPEVRTP
jgi:hypothetical protein